MTHHLGDRLLGASLADLGRFRPAAADLEAYFAARDGARPAPARDPVPAQTGRWVPAS